MSTHIWVKQLKGQAGKPESQKLILQGLGLKRVGDERTLRDTPAIRGMIQRVQHLVDIQVRQGQIALTGARSRRAE
ncbi:MAG: 50S ribosomal protein L30 [Myxococcaceae bacterium]|nr:50S ribosomal protein L30 [Myxococcaceae bacterium]MBH2006955.1 50S ribosomal protein L30 [Myxococcaceae bacterium]